MAYVTKAKVIETFENVINDGRDIKIKVSGLNSPLQTMSKMTPTDFAKLDALNLYKGVSANSYDVQMSMLWTTLFWKISEQILIVGNYTSEFERFYQTMGIGTDIEEAAPRLKEGIDRQTLSNSALFTNYVTQYDSFYHRMNQFKVFATTYDQYEIARISNSWDNITNHLNSELENIIKSSSVYIHDLSKDAFVSQYLAGGMDFVSLPNITDNFTAAQNAIQIHNAMDKMTIETNMAYIPFNRNALNQDPTIKDIATSDLLLIARADLMNNVEFLTTLNTYFEGTFKNKRFAFNMIKVDEFPTVQSPNIAITPGYTPLSDPKKLKAILVEENSIIFRKKEIGTFNFDNAATLKTSIFRHLDAMANLSDRRKAVAFTEE